MIKNFIINLHSGVKQTVEKLQDLTETKYYYKTRNVKDKKLMFLYEKKYFNKDKLVSVIPCDEKENQLNKPKSLNKSIEYMVKNWRHKFKLPVNREFRYNLTPEEIELDFNIIFEEFNELKTALEQKNLKEIYDGLGDVQFVLWQLYSRMGITEELLSKITKRVYDSNMTKACYTREDAEKTVDFYTTERGVECTIDDENENFMLVFRKDGKLLKNIVEFKEPDFTGIQEQN